MWFAGGGVKPGTIVGETDEMGLRGAGSSYSMRDFHATILHLLGFDQNRLWFLHNGRNEKLTDFGGTVIRRRARLIAPGTFDRLGRSRMSNNNPISRREALAAGTAFTTSLFTGQVKGANDRIRVGYHRPGRDGFGQSGLLHEGARRSACGVVRCLPAAPGARRGRRAKGGFQPKSVKDFREVLADKSIDAVCISTPGSLARVYDRGGM